MEAGSGSGDQEEARKTEVIEAAAKSSEEAASSSEKGREAETKETNGGEVAQPPQPPELPQQPQEVPVQQQHFTTATGELVDGAKVQVKPAFKSND